MKRRAKKLKQFLRPMRNEKYILILTLGLFCLMTIIICSVLFYLSTPVKIAGSLECSAKGNINNTDGKLKIQQLSDIQCAGTFDTEIPLMFTLILGDVN